VKAVNSQDEFNKDGIIRAIPIIAYHDLDHNITPDSTNVNLFDAEMKYLYDNGFTVLTMADLGYDESTHQLYIRYIGPSTIKQIGSTITQTEAAVPDDDDNDAAAEEEDDMGLESDNNDDIGFDNGEIEEDNEVNSNELSESNTGEEDDEDDDNSGSGA
jgi:hypothetical protein